MSELDPERRYSIGASELAGVLGYSKWSSPLSVWADKLWPEERDPDSEPERFAIGHAVEPAIFDLFWQRTGKIAHAWDQEHMIRHPNPEIPMSCTPDAFVSSEEHRILSVGFPKKDDIFFLDDSCDEKKKVIPTELLEAKTVSHYAARDWEDGGAPIYYVIQCQGQMACTGAKLVYLCALIDNSRFVIREIKRDDRFIALAEKKVTEFWNEYIIPKKMPAPSATSLDVSTLQRLHPDDDGTTVELGEEFVGLDRKLEDLKEQIKEKTALKKRIENEIKTKMVGATYATIPGVEGRYSWKTIEKKEKLVKASKFRMLRRLKR